MLDVAATADIRHVSTCTTTSEGWSAANRDRGRHLGACWACSEAFSIMWSLTL